MHQQANTAHRRNEVLDTWVTHQIEGRALGSFFPSDLATVKGHGLAMWVRFVTSCAKKPLGLAATRAALIFSRMARVSSHDL